ncbi:MAG: GNAT family N-acetyltransferase [Actinomycetota bacterium]
MILRGDAVVLRPLRVDEVELLRRHWGQRDPRTRPGTPLPVERIRRRVERSGRFFRGRLDLAIEVDDRLVGDIQARRHPAQTLPPGTFELGIEVFEGADRGRGFGAESVALLTRWLFEQQGAERIQVSTATDNSAMRAVLERLRFPFEGVLRDFMPVEQAREDYAMYALTRADWAHGLGRDRPARSG